MSRDLRLLIECVVALRRAKVQLERIGDLRQLLADLDRSASAGAVDDGASAADLVRATDRSLRLLGPRENPCVARSLTLLLLWSGRRRPAVFVSGVMRLDGELRGHAWLEAPDLDGRIGGRIEGPDAYAENFRFPNCWTGDDR